ncbi:hypothetical protein SELMODRAFT_154638 [Selaginella moellendorffii]|uniref:RING-type domain-containing protein n=1 Tax=Selaginella moellendorffii TaxID=88036 RepID=D8SE52_SELML|nr:protein NCA1 [Selaginella moellendorffii]EFJ17444.1 hypothetical protein SELMODRAFT_154638 [Selaginella moellendorffii]|eukprot:XP_002981629.1 protein NCA1 [Selaginella moellendorffii]
MACPFGGATHEVSDSSPKCPLGYDTASFKLGPLSCLVCRALLFKAARCLPCRHVFCSACIARFSDCPLCGVDISGLEEDGELQKLVDQFIQGHARVRRQQQQQEEGPVVYEDASLARGSFLLQHAMRAFQAQNLESSKARLDLCVEDTREMMETKGASAEVCSQHGAVLGLLGDCLRAMGDLDGAMDKYAESVSVLQAITGVDVNAEIVHALSVSLNKLGDLKYYADDLECALALYKQALQVRDRAQAGRNDLSAESIDVVVSLAKVADVQRAMGRDSEAAEGFTAAITRLEHLTCPPSPRDESLNKRRASVLGFLHAQQQQQQQQETKAKKKQAQAP